jgi:hypothetical protein
LQPARAFFIGILLLNYNSTTVATDRIAAYLQNDDSHPYTVAPGDSARFTIGHSQAAAFMDVKCSLEGDMGMPVSAVILRTRGLTDIQWPFASHTIRIDGKIVFDMTAWTQPGVARLAYFEFINEDAKHSLWTQCHNN